MYDATLKPMFSSGIESLDEMLQGVLAGDNVVWQVDDVKDVIPFTHSFCRWAHHDGKKLVYFRFAAHDALVPDEFEAEVHTLNAKAGTKGHLYGSITSADIAAELLANTGIEIDKRKIELAESIRQLGSYEATIKLARDITPKIRVNVVEDKEPKPGERK